MNTLKGIGEGPLDTYDTDDWPTAQAGFELRVSRDGVVQTYVLRMVER